MHPPISNEIWSLSRFKLKYNPRMKNNKNGLHVERLDNGMRLETN